MDIRKRNQEVKKVLRNKFPTAEISVRNGTGTAYGWCDARLTLPKPNTCECQPGQFICKACREYSNQVYSDAQKATESIEFYHYYDDMGYSNREFNVHVSLR